MKNIMQTMPGYQVNDYMLILSPGTDLESRIMKIRKEFANNFQAKPAGGRPHITLVRFSQFAMLEERLVQRLKTIGMGFQPFKVELKDFGSFPSHTVFINVITKVAVQKLVKEIKTAQSLMKIDAEHKPHFIEDPYIPIASKLLPWQFEKGWLEYSNSQFTGRFIADSMLLLKRTQGSGFQIVERFGFLNLPVTTKQGELFA